MPKAPRGPEDHFHLVLAVRPDVARAWTDDELVDRWQRIYRSKCERANAKRRAEMLADSLRMQQTRERLASLSWFMKCLNEHVSRIANAEDQTSGHFWEARFKSQVLLDERALLAAMPLQVTECTISGAGGFSIRQPGFPTTLAANTALPVQIEFRSQRYAVEPRVAQLRCTTESAGAVTEADWTLRARTVPDIFAPGFEGPP